MEDGKIEENVEGESEIDSVIQDDDQVDFTESIKYMKGTPLPMKLADKLREDAIFDPNPQITNALASSYISNTSAKKTAYQSLNTMMDYKYKEENILKIDAAVK